MKRLLFLLLVAVSYSSFVHSQRASISGIVKDMRGNLLAGAAVYVHDIKTGTLTDSLGKYLITGVPTGHYLVEASYPGYASMTASVSIKGNTVHDFILEEAIVEQQGVIVTGVATATRMKQSTQPVTLVRKTDLMKTVSTNIIEALAKQPGVSALTTGPAIAKPVIRGLGYNRMVVINDGVRQEGQQWGDEHGIEIDEYSIQRAEILKGPASLMYGSDAMAGVINLMTNTPVEQGTIKGNLFSNYIDNNRQLGLHGNLAGHLVSGFNWNLYGSYKKAGDYQNKYDGYVFNSRFNERNFGGYAGVNKPWGYSHLIVTNFLQRAGMVEGERDTTTGKFIAFGGTPDERVVSNADLRSKELFTPYQSINHFKITSDNSFRLPKGRMNLLLGLQENKRKEFGDPTAPDEPELFFDLRTINYNLQYHSPASTGGWATSVGINGMYQQNRNLADEVLIPEYNQLDAGIFVYTRKSLKNYTLSGGLRADVRKLDTDRLIEGGDLRFEALDKSFSNLSGSVGISYEVAKNLVLKANLARAYRAPNVAELSSNGAHEGTNRYEYGQSDLKSETSLQADLGLELNSMHLGISFTPFYNNIQHYIFYRKLSGVNGSDSIVVVDGEEMTAFRFDQSAASLYGFELSFDLHPHPLDWLHFENSFSFVRGQFHTAIEGSRNLPFMPPARWNSELRTDFKKVGNYLQNLYLRMGMEHVFNQDDVFTTYDTETATPGYTLLNAGIGTDVGYKGKRLLSLHLSVNNIGDVAYQSHLGRLKYTDENRVTGRQGVFNMGRSFNVKMNVPLAWKVK